MKYFIPAPDDGSGRAVVKNAQGWVFGRYQLDKAREICKGLNDAAQQNKKKE